MTAMYVSENLLKNKNIVSIISCLYIHPSIIENNGTPGDKAHSTFVLCEMAFSQVHM